MTGTQLRLAYEITAAGEALVMLSGELDIASSDGAFGCVRDVIDRHHMPVILDTADLSFCDARGLGTLVRMSNYAGQAGCSLWLASPGPRLLKIMRITGLDSSLAIRVPLSTQPQPPNPALAVPQPSLILPGPPGIAGVPARAFKMFDQLGRRGSWPAGDSAAPGVHLRDGRD